ncbi:unnamed protein product [Dicrocoelium dendriticum]|nr:unnamed protein product [Dicrocoelium dendriticum]
MHRIHYSRGVLRKYSSTSPAEHSRSSTSKLNPPEEKTKRNSMPRSSLSVREPVTPKNSSLHAPIPSSSLSVREPATPKNSLVSLPQILKPYMRSSLRQAMKT